MPFKTLCWKSNSRIFENRDYDLNSENAFFFIIIIIQQILQVLTKDRINKIKTH